MSPQFLMQRKQTELAETFYRSEALRLEMGEASRGKQNSEAIFKTPGYLCCLQGHPQKKQNTHAVIAIAQVNRTPGATGAKYEATIGQQMADKADDVLTPRRHQWTRLTFQCSTMTCSSETIKDISRSMDSSLVITLSSWFSLAVDARFGCPTFVAAQILYSTPFKDAQRTKP